MLWKMETVVSEKDDKEGEGSLRAESNRSLFGAELNSEA